MLVVIVIDLVIGLVPFLGDFLDALFKANTINAALLERALRDPRYNVGNPETLGEPRVVEEGLQTAASQPRSGAQNVYSSRRPRDDIENFGPPPSYDVGTPRREAVQHDPTLDAGITRPEAVQLNKEKSSGGWLQRFTGPRTSGQQPDLEKGIARGARNQRL